MFFVVSEIPMQPLSQHQTLFFRMPQGTHYKSPQAMQRGGSQAQTTYFRTQRQLNDYHNLNCSCSNVLHIILHISHCGAEAQQVVTRQEEALRERETLTYAPALTKLKLEADKIRKWKTATQFELKKKVIIFLYCIIELAAWFNLCVHDSVV